MIAKIFYIMECKECHHCSQEDGFPHWCIEEEKVIPDIESISAFCSLEDATKFIEWKKKEDSELLESEDSEMIVNGAKTNWSKATIFNRPGAKKCEKCNKNFVKNEIFSVRETKISWFRGEDKVSFFCRDCTPTPIKKILKM